MAVRFLKNIFISPLGGVLLVAALLTSLHLLSSATEGDSPFHNEYFYLFLIIINVVVLLTLVVLIARQLLKLLRQLRRGVAGSRLTLRMIIIFVTLAVLPVSVVYYFSLQFLHRSIDSWFNLQVETALGDALDLSRASLDERKRNNLRQIQRAATDLGSTTIDGTLVLRLAELLERSGATEVTLMSSRGQVLSSSSVLGGSIVPDLPGENLLSLMGDSNEFVELFEDDSGQLLLRVLVKVHPETGTSDYQLLQAMFPVNARDQQLALSVEEAYQTYQKLVSMRKPLKANFTLALSIVLLLGLLSAVWAAFLSARRLASPIRDLAEGTQAVAQGHYDRRIPLLDNDDLGQLVESFNKMTRRLSRARDDLQQSQEQTEQQRAYLEAILSSLFSGILTLDSDRTLKITNRETSAILGIELDTYVDESIDVLAKKMPNLEPFVELIKQQFELDSSRWQQEVTLFGEQGRQVLACRGSRLADGGMVLVVEDITTLIQAQRDAAWGEVARRMAHEIKNPLTPIQLSAERLQHKYLPKMEGKDAETLQRLTHTIVQQVGSMKEMVQAFSDYARMPKLDMHPLDLEQLVKEVLELYRGHRNIKILVRNTVYHAMINGDANRLRQVLHNLIKNALEATEDQTERRLTVTLQCQARENCSHVELRIADNGPGIDEEMLSHLFEPYVTSKSKGTGLGLAIVKKIIEEHGGVIHAENQAEGMVVVMRFPLHMYVDQSPAAHG